MTCSNELQNLIFKKYFRNNKFENHLEIQIEIILDRCDSNWDNMIPLFYLSQADQQRLNTIHLKHIMKYFMCSISDYTRVNNG